MIIIDNAIFLYYILIMIIALFFILIILLNHKYFNIRERFINSTQISLPVGYNNISLYNNNIGRPELQGIPKPVKDLDIVRKQEAERSKDKDYNDTVDEITNKYGIPDDINKLSFMDICRRKKLECHRDGLTSLNEDNVNDKDSGKRMQCEDKLPEYCKNINSKSNNPKNIPKKGPNTTGLDDMKKHTNKLMSKNLDIKNTASSKLAKHTPISL